MFQVTSTNSAGRRPSEPTPFNDAIELGSNHLKGALNDVVDPSSTEHNGNLYMRPSSLASRADYDDADHEKYRRSNWVQKITVGMVALLFGMLAVVIAVASATYDKVDKFEAKVVTVYDSVGLPGYEGYSWTDVVSAANGQDVNFYTYSDPSYNSWIDTWLTPRLASIYGINLVRHPLTDTVDAVERVEREYGLYGATNGSVDMIWINGENFARLKRQGYAYGPWATKVPNAANFDFTAPAIAYDFGTATQGFEMPYNGAQVIFIYNNATVKVSEIDTISEIVTWVNNNPGNFTYAAPCANADCSNYDYTGSVFIRHLFYSLATPSYTVLLKDTAVDETLYAKIAPTFFKTLRDMEPNLYANSSYYGGHYPSAHSKVEDLFAKNKVQLTLSYEVGQATNNIALGVWSGETTATVVLTSGTISNTNYVLIPGNSKHRLAAVVAGNYIASTQAMFSRQQPDTLAAQQVYNSAATPFVSGGWNDAFDYIDRPVTTPSTATLSAYAMPELSPAYINRIQSDWYKCVLAYSASTSPSYCTP